MVFALCALLVYRRRHIETAGDVVSVAVVRPVFRVGVAFCVGLFFGSFTAAFFGWENTTPVLCVLVVLWSVVGWFAAEMLLRKSFRVFRRWKGAAAMACVMAVLCASFYFDWFGVENRVPAPDQVGSIEVSMQLGYPQDSACYLSAEVDDPQLMEQFIQLHQTLVEEKPGRRGQDLSYDEIKNLRLTYRLKNGRTLSRSYDVPVSLADLDRADTLSGQYSSLGQNRALARLAYRLDEMKPENLADVRLAGVYQGSWGNLSDFSLENLSRKDMAELWQAVLLDMDEGNLGKRWPLDTPERFENTLYSDLVFLFDIPDDSRVNTETAENYDMYEGAWDMARQDEVTVTLTPGAVHTLSALYRLHVLPEGWHLVANHYVLMADNRELAVQQEPETCLDLHEDGSVAKISAP